MRSQVDGMAALNLLAQKEQARRAPKSNELLR